MSKLRLLGIAFFVCCLIVGTSGAAERPRVVHVVDTAAADSGDPGVSAQLGSELRGVGFDVQMTRMTGVDAPDALRRAASETGSIAAISISRRGGALVAKVWLTDRKTHEESLRSVSVSESADEPIRVLALRVAELLHASSLELSLARQAEPAEETASPPNSAAEQPPPPGASSHGALTGEPAPAPGRDDESSERAPSAAVTSSSPERDYGQASAKQSAARTRYGFALGASALTGPGGLGLGLAPALLVSFRVLDRCATELYATGPVLGTVRDSTGSASIDQELAALRLRYEIGDGRWVPFIAAGAGGYRLGARGNAAEPFSGESDHAISALAVAGGGLRFGASDNLTLFAEGDGVFVTPRPALRFADRSIAKTARPLLTLMFAAELGW